MRVLKIGGGELDSADFLTGLGQSIAKLGEPVVIVHGGGPAIANMQASLGLETKKVDGLRVTDADSLSVAEMVLSGQTNKLLVKALQDAGVDAVGISGVDGGLLQAQKKHHPTTDLGFVGEIVGVRTTLLHSLLNLGITPVVSPISRDAHGTTFNINADEAATAIAAALPANLCDFISNVPGVLQDGALLPELSLLQTNALIEDGTIRDGMIPKVKSALSAVKNGVPRARIVNLAGLELLTAGTTFTQTPNYS